VWWALVAHW